MFLIPPVVLFLSLGLQTPDEAARALLEAAREGDAERVAELLASGVPVDAESPNGMTALHVASLLGHGKLVELLLHEGANVDDAAVNGMTPLMRAAMNGHAGVVERLLAAGARVDHQATYGATALMSAADGGHAAVVRKLLAAGADPSLRAGNGETASSLAAAEGREEIVGLLSPGAGGSAGADPGYAEARARIHYRAGIEHDDGGRLDEAIELYRRALERRREFPEAQYRLARALARAGEELESRLYYRKCVATYERLLDRGAAFDRTFASVVLEDVCEALRQAGMAEDRARCEGLYETLAEEPES